MKKVLSMILVLALVFALVVPALADSNNDESIGYIEYSINGGTKWQKAPEYTGDYGHRVAFQCSSALFPNAPWDYVFTDADWAKIEKTMIQIRILVPEGTIDRIWCYAWTQGDVFCEGGYLLELNPGFYELWICNGEAQNWPEDESFAKIDLDRIFDQARNGNANVEHSLAFAGITANLANRVPTDLKYDDVVAGPVSSKKPNN